MELFEQPLVQQPTSSEALDQFMPAFLQAQAKFVNATRDNKGNYGKYATLDSVLDSVKGALNEAGIVIVQSPYNVYSGDRSSYTIVLFSRFIHVSGQWIGSHYPLRPSKPDAQGDGSALTYARRYALMALAGIAPDDDEGEAAVKQQRAARESQTDKLSEQAPDIRPAQIQKIKALSDKIGRTTGPQVTKHWQSAMQTTVLVNAGTPEQLAAYIEHLNRELSQLNQPDEMAQAIETAKDTLGAEPTE
jgi:ERF superfamily